MRTRDARVPKSAQFKGFSGCRAPNHAVYCTIRSLFGTNIKIMKSRSQAEDVRALTHSSLAITIVLHKGHSLSANSMASGQLYGLP